MSKAKLFKTISISPQIKSLVFLTKLEKKIASEISRFTNKKMWFYKSLSTFSEELSSTPKSIKKTYSKLKANGWLESKKTECDGRVFEYRMTQNFFDLITVQQENTEVWPSINLPKSNREVTENLPKSNQEVTEKYELLPSPSNVEATKQAPNVLNIECIKDLNIEREKEKTVPNTSEIVSLDSLLKFLEISYQDMEHPPVWKSVNNVLKVLSLRATKNTDLPQIRKLIDPKKFFENKISSLHWGGWLNQFDAEQSKEILKIVEVNFQEIEVNPNDFESEKAMREFTKKLDAQGKKYNVLQITYSTQLIWDTAIETELEAESNAKQFNITLAQESKAEESQNELISNKNPKTPMEIVIESLAKKNPELAKEFEKNQNNLYLKVAKK